VLRKVQQQMERLEAASQSVAQRVRDAEKELLFLNKHARETAAASDATHADLDAVRADTFALAQELQSAERALVQVTEATEQRQQAQVANKHSHTTVSSDLRQQVLSIVDDMQRLEEEKKTLEASRSNPPTHTHGASTKQQLVRLLCVYVCVIYIYIYRKTRSSHSYSLSLSVSLSLSLSLSRSLALALAVSLSLSLSIYIGAPARGARGAHSAGARR
jgi:uncharacterized protein (UPF0335 family)